MLQASYEKFETPPILIDQSQIPYVPQVEAPEVAHVLPAIVTRLINKLGLEAGKNPVRMFSYNLLKRNNWQNQYFEELFQLTVGHLRMLLRDHQTAGATALSEQSADTILSLFSSSLIFIPEFEELKEVISPQQFEACSQNTGLLYNVKKELESMNHGYPPQYMPQHQQAPQYMPQQQPQHNQNVAFDQRTGAFYDKATGAVIGYGAPPQGQYPPVQMQHPGMYPPPGMQHNPAMMNIGFIPNQQPYQHGTPYRPPVMQRPDVTITRNYGRNDETTTAPTVAHGHPALNQGSQFRHRQYEPEAVLSPSVDYRGNQIHQQFDAQKEEPMNRQQHEAPNVSGVVTIAEKEHLEKVAAKQVAKIDNFETATAEMDIDAAIEQFRAKVISSGVSTMQRKYFIVPTPLMSKLDVKSFLKTWTKGDSLITIALSLSAAMESASVFTSPDSADPIEDVRNLKSLIRGFDLIITRRVNTFLNDIIEAPFRMQSFMEDYQDVPGELRRKMGNEAAERLAVYDAEFSESFNSEFLAEYAYETDFLNIGSSINVVYVTTVIATTLITMDRVELKIPLTAGKIYIDESNNPLVFRVAQSVFDPQEADMSLEQLNVETHLLITKDGARYFIGNDTGTDKYYLRQI